MAFPPAERVTGDLASLLRRWGVGAHPLDWRLPPIETYPAVVAFVQTLPGRLALFGLFAVMMQPLSLLWIELTVAAAAVSLAGRHRPLVALACTAAMLVRAPNWYNYEVVEAIAEQEGLAGAVSLGWLQVLTLAACAPVAALSIHLARRFRDHPLGRRPVLAQHLLCVLLIGLAVSHLLQGLPQLLLWSLVATFFGYFWFLAYALMEQRQRQPAPLLLHYATFHPFFALTTVVPMGKGASNWCRLEAATSEELAVTQLKGLKLLAWVYVLKVVLKGFRWIVYGRLGVPPLEDAFLAFLDGATVPAPQGLASVVANFPEQLLLMAIWGHMIIAVARLAGFRLLRNSCRPLESRSIAEFWNRYFYYFKELLVHVYFYPTYVRCLKDRPRLRIAFATFMAAGVGNFFFHFILENRAIGEVGLLEALRRGQTYAFYCAVLVAGIVVSQLRAARPDARAGWLKRQFLPSLWVAVFFCFLSFFDGPQGHVALARHFEFLFHVLGLDRWI